MESSELLQQTAVVLEELEIPYFVTGSMATIAYGEPRFTIDVDVVARLTPVTVDAFCAAFPFPEFNFSLDAAREAVHQRRQFNIIHPASGLKVDVMIPADTEFNQSRLSRRLRISAGDDFAAWFASPEDVIIKKLEYYREGGSDKHLRDIAGVLKIRGDKIDTSYINRWTEILRLTEQWELVRLT